jgi:mercuric transport protein
MRKSRVATLLGIVFMLALSASSVFAVSKSVTIRVEGMKCNHCSSSVAKALKATDGVEKVEISHEKGEAVIQYDDQKVTEVKLREVINGTGFKAVEEKSAKN